MTSPPYRPRSYPNIDGGDPRYIQGELQRVSDALGDVSQGHFTNLTVDHLTAPDITTVTITATGAMQFVSTGGYNFTGGDIITDGALDLNTSQYINWKSSGVTKGSMTTDSSGNYIVNSSVILLNAPLTIAVGQFNMNGPAYLPTNTLLSWYSAGPVIDGAIGADSTGKFNVTTTSGLYVNSGEIPLSVKSYGAVGDGTTDDTAAIQACINSGRTNIYIPKGTYKITSTLLVSKKLGLHIYGDSGGSNGAGASRLFWSSNTPNGTIFELYSSSDCLIERLAFIGTDSAFVAKNPGVGIFVTALNSDGPTHNNTFRDLSVSNITGAPGHAILIGSPINGGTGVSEDIATNSFENILTVFPVNCLVQFGNQTVNNYYRNFECLLFSGLGMQFIDGDVRVEGGSFFGTATATADIEVGSDCLNAHIFDCYSEIDAGRSPNGIAFSFPAGARTYSTEINSNRVLWAPAAGTLLSYLQNGPISFHDNSMDGAGTGTLTVTTGGATIRPAIFAANYRGATITHSVSGKANLIYLDNTILTQDDMSLLVSTANPAAATGAKIMSFTSSAVGMYTCATFPPTFSAPQGSLCFIGNADATHRLYVNTSAGSGTTWTVI